MYNENMKKDSKKDMNSKKSENPNHKHEIPRLNRAIGQLEGIKKMIEEQRYCPGYYCAAQGCTFSNKTC